MFLAGLFQPLCFNTPPFADRSRKSVVSWVSQLWGSSWFYLIRTRKLLILVSKTQFYCGRNKTPFLFAAQPSDPICVDAIKVTMGSRRTSLNFNTGAFSMVQPKLEVGWRESDLLVSLWVIVSSINRVHNQTNVKALAFVNSRNIKFCYAQILKPGWL